jgi:hypothetical protein
MHELEARGLVAWSDAHHDWLPLAPLAEVEDAYLALRPSPWRAAP